MFEPFPCKTKFHLQHKISLSGMCTVHEYCQICQFSLYHGKYTHKSISLIIGSKWHIFYLFVVPITRVGGPVYGTSPEICGGFQAKCEQFFIYFHLNCTNGSINSYLVLLGHIKNQRKNNQINHLAIPH